MDDGETYRKIELGRIIKLDTPAPASNRDVIDVIRNALEMAYESEVEGVFVALDFGDQKYVEFNFVYRGADKEMVEILDDAIVEILDEQGD